MAITLKVKPEQLKEKSDAIEASIIVIEKEFKELQSTIEKTKVYWEGDASDMHQKHYKKFKDEVPKIIKRLKEHPTDLLKMANLYETSENKNQALAMKLPSDVIK